MANPLKISEYLKKHRLNTVMRRFLIGAASVVVFVTTYMLILPAITLELQELNNPAGSVSSNEISGSVSGSDLFVSVSSGDLITGTETQEDWEKITEGVALTGNWAEDVIAIARTQLGYRESTGNYLIGDDGEPMGYTRYGDWYGEPYGDWSAMFVSFCLNYAQVNEDVIPREADSQRWIETLTDETVDRYYAAADYTPVAGDMIFLDLDGDGEADHAGIVEVVSESTENEPAQVKAIVGDSDNMVQYNTYALQDEQIIGYGRMENPSVITYKKTYRDEKVVITACYTENAQIPKEAELQAYQVTAETAPERYETRQQETHAALQALNAAEAAENEENGILKTKKDGTVTEEPEKEYLIYNIGFYLDGQELEPADAVNITIQFLSEDGFAVGDPVTIVHFSEAGTETLTGADVTQDVNGVLSTSFETANFSDFAITFDSAGADVPVVYAATTEVVYVSTAESVTDADGNVTKGLNDYLRDANFNGTIQLTADLNYTNETAPGLGGNDQTQGRNVTIDLNGHDITVNGTLVNVYYGAALEIKDSSAVTDGGQPVAETAGKNLYGNAAFPGADGTWYYYVTETTPTGESDGSTTETLIEHTVSGGGVITGTSAGNAVFYIHSDADKTSATLTINGGIIANCANRAVDMKGGTLNLNGGYLFGNTVSGQTTNYGGAIRATDINDDGTGLAPVIINLYDKETAKEGLNGTVLAGNKAENGGAISVEKSGNGATLNINGGVVSGNIATNNGGGIRVQNCKVTMTGGYITNNISQGADYYDGGGGVLIRGETTFTMSGGYITGNEAASGGGIYTYTEDAVNFAMSGGYITANYARTAEGGGIRIDVNGIGTFTGGYITNNKTATDQHWGGGGLFVADGGIAYLTSVLVTENAADGFGGGVAGCSTGRIYMSAIDYQSKGAAIFDNTAYVSNPNDPNSMPGLSGDESSKAEDHIFAYSNPVFMENGYEDFFCVLYSHVQNGMLGGGSEEWSGSIDGVAVNLSGSDDQATANSVIGLTANPTDVDQSKAMAEGVASLYINGNSSATHGGGILCNGYVVLGATTAVADIELGTRIELMGTKELLNDAGVSQELEAGKFSFTVSKINDDKTKVEVAKATNDAAGNLVFDRRIVFDSEGTYTFIVTEDETEESGSGITTDQTQYQITVNIIKVYLDHLVGSDGTLRRALYSMQKLEIKRMAYGSDTWNVVNSITFDTSTYAEQESRGIDIALSSDTTFINYQLTKTDITVEKKWTDGVPLDIDGVTVDLYRNNNIIQSQKLGNWQNGIVYDTAGTITDEKYARDNTTAGHFKDTITFPSSVSGRWIRVYCQERAYCTDGYFGYSLYEVEIYGEAWNEDGSPKNLATGKNVKVSSEENAECKGEYAVDGSTDTRWASAWGESQDTSPYDQYLLIDLGQSTKISSIVLDWQDAYATKYQIQVLDEDAWTYTWKDLDVYVDSTAENKIPYVYTVEEQTVEGYLADYAITTTGGSTSYWVPATSLEAGKKYMIVNSTDQYALNVTLAHRGDWFDASDWLGVTKSSGSLQIGDETYSDWYNASTITEPKMVFTAQNFDSHSECKSVVLKNIGNENSWLLIEANGSGQKLKGTEGVGNIKYASQFWLDTEGRLQGHYGFRTSSDAGYGDPHTVVFTNGKFNALNTQAELAGAVSSGATLAKVYTLVHTVTGGATTMTITNTPLSEIDFSVEITKVGEKKDAQGNDILLSGAKFKIVDSNNADLKFVQAADGSYQLSGEESASNELVTDANGLIKITGLKAGTYTWVETNAPAGYNIATKPVDGESSLFTLDENTSSAKYEIKIADPLIQYELPATGSNGTILYTMAGVLMIGNASYLLYREKKRRRKGAFSP